ncbi:hexokinase family protein [Treponema pallidum]|uniref:Hexokinase (Hxk) n=7 Tax=Treponema pallidum TaxID=160 RepID=O83518_TREPA|nr:hexokinase [Treponema pallidum]AAC65489.1 hexokinase (hxk) [Treponema pallidum subsp. pallidum str. Nichols]ACD70928.1 hexokinase [Treponema pallidum subsp. pallidum SS14]ADD72617.1 hexokinase [Treponema pallidum subsp. pallidum str. Chicago]AEZ57626.1 hexokinase [Treponema pallidum subsp. pertenue str. SamoaD]AEZ58695.1 hexokinase [Treponema pallidum subsp. pertenue str. CDC2]
MDQHTRTRDLVSAFFGRFHFDVQGPSVRTVVDVLRADMVRGLEEEAQLPPRMGSALAMIPTWVAPPRVSPCNRRVIVIDAGGTNFRSCLVRFGDSGTPHIENLEKRPMPGTTREYSRTEFFGEIADNLARLKGAADCIGFCFSYPIRIRPDGDGEVIQFAKEIKAAEVIGTCVGAGLTEALSARNWPELRSLKMLNDATSALLAGFFAAPEGCSFSSYVGFILGTGMNSAYLEPDPIPKIPAHHTPQVVVCESGKSNKVPRSVFDELFTQTTAEPDIAHLEKMSSGTYLGPLASVVVRLAAQEGLFSHAVHAALSTVSFTLVDMDRFLFAPSVSTTTLGALLAPGTDTDREILFLLLDAVVARAARIAAGVIAASVLKSGAGYDPLRPVCVLAEGTTFQRTYRLRTRVTSHLQAFLTEERGVYFDIISLENAVTLGSALGGLSS